MNEANEYLVLEWMQKVKERILWDAVSLSEVFGGSRHAYPASEGVAYRKVLKALKGLQEKGVIGVYKTTMNENVYFEKSRLK